MIDEAVKADQDNVPAMLAKAYGLIETYELDEAIRCLESALSLDYEHEELLHALRCFNWLKDRVERLGAEAPCFERGEALFGIWKGFKAFEAKRDTSFERVAYAARRYLFGKAIGCFLPYADEPEESRRGEVHLRIGRCMKFSGDYVGARAEMEKAVASLKEDAQAIAELADLFALIGEVRPAKVLFREAFFVDPLAIDLDFIESGMLGKVIESLKAKGLSGKPLLAWIPVHAALGGVLNVKRELRPIELGKLMQSVYSMEAGLREAEGDAHVAVPLLINRYFWLIDHYASSGGDKAKIDELLLKVKLLDSKIYESYIS
jgi:tetratricopeptide (TPR) repeat protein